MNARVQNHVSGRLSLRPPQAESLARLKRALDAAPEYLDVTALGEALHRAGFAAHWMGRGDA